MHDIRKAVGTLILSLHEAWFLNSNAVIRSLEHAQYLEGSTIELIQEKTRYPISIAILQSPQQAQYLMNNTILQSLCKAKFSHRVCMTILHSFWSPFELIILRGKPMTNFCLRRRKIVALLYKSYIRAKSFPTGSQKVIQLFFDSFILDTEKRWNIPVTRKTQSKRAIILVINSRICVCPHLSHCSRVPALTTFKTIRDYWTFSGKVVPHTTANIPRKGATPPVQGWEVPLWTTRSSLWSSASIALIMAVITIFSNHCFHQNENVTQ